MHVAFNQDASCCVAGTEYGFRVYNCSPFGRFYTSDSAMTLGGVGVARMLFSTSLIALVGNGELNSPRRLAIVNTRKNIAQATVCELTFPTTVRSLALNRRRLVVVLDAQIYIYNIANMKLLYTMETVSNRSGLASVTPNVSSGSGGSAAASLRGDEKTHKRRGSRPSSADQDAGDESTGSANAETAKDVQMLESDSPRKEESSVGESNWLVFPAGPPTKHHVAPPKSASDIPKPPKGDVTVFDMDTLAPVAVIRAHRAPVAMLTLNEDGTLLATTSEKGTLIRVFAVPTGTLLYEFRRGSYQSHVYSLTFSLGSKFLCVTSATQTVHIYKLAPENLHKRKSSSGAAAHTADGEESDDEDAQSGAGDMTADSSQVADTSGEIDNDASETSANAGSAPADSVKKKKRWFSTSWTKPILAHPQKRDFAWFKLPLKHDVRTTIGVAPLSNVIYVASESGMLYHYALDVEKGGECRKVGEFQMD